MKAIIEIDIDENSGKPGFSSGFLRHLQFLSSDEERNDFLIETAFRAFQRFGITVLGAELVQDI